MSFRPSEIAARFARVTTSNRFIPEIDGLRFVAISTVILFHLTSIPMEFASGGDTYFSFVRGGTRGVELFFIISGFILGLPFLESMKPGGKPVSLKKYFLRRVTRLEPPYIFSLLLLGSALVVLKRETMSTVAMHMLAGMAYLHNIIYRAPNLVNKSAWSLEIEIQFYVLVPLIMVLLRKGLGRVRSLLLFLVVFGILTTIVLPPEFPQTILSQFQFFLLGIFFATLYSDGRLKTQSWGYDVLAVAASAGLLALFHFAFNTPYETLLLPWLLAAVFVSAFKGVLMNRLFRNRYLTTIGGMCYTIYLIHGQIIKFCALKLATRFHSYWPLYIAVIVVATPAIALVSAVLFKAIEQPCMNPEWYKKFAFSKPPKAMAAETAS